MSLIQFKDRANDIDSLKAKINAYRPIPQEVTAQIKEKFRIVSAYSSCALDGISFDELETRTVLELGKAIGGKSIREHLELLGHSEAYDFLWEAARRGTTAVTLDDLLKFHQLYYYRINKPQAGKLRKGKAISNPLGEGEAAAPEQITPLLEEFISSLPDLDATRHPVNLAALLYLRLMNIQPFIEGNGRIARLLMNLSLMQHGYYPVIINPEMRHDYITSMRVASKGDAQPFLKFISQMAYESHVEYLRVLQELMSGAKSATVHSQEQQAV